MAGRKADVDLVANVAFDQKPLTRHECAFCSLILRKEREPAGLRRGRL